MVKPAKVGTVIALLAIVIAGYTFFLHSSSDHTPVVAHAPGSTDGAPAYASKGLPAPRTGVVPAASSLQSLPAAGLTARLREQMSAAQDLRAFALSAKNRPGEGGYFYARYVANICGRDFTAIGALGAQAIAEKIRTTGTVSTEHLLNADDLPRRCAAFVADEATQIVQEMRSKEATGRDPLLAAERHAFDAFKSRDSQALRTAFEQLARINDPLLWTQHGLYNFIVSGDPEARKETGGFYFDGKVYTPAEESAYAETRLALDLGFCHENEPCELDFVSRIVCSSAGNCASDRYAFLKAQYLANGGDEAGWSRVLVLEKRVRAGVAAGAVSMFVR